MSPISSFGNAISTTAASSARPADTDRVSKVTGDFSGLEAFQSAQSSTPFSVSNPGFGSRSAGAAFSVPSFLG